MDVGFKESDADFAQGFFHVRGREFAFAAQIFEDTLKLVGKIIEHVRKLDCAGEGAGRPFLV